VLVAFDRPFFTELERFFGSLVTVLTAPGVVFHELGHYVSAKAAGRPIDDVSLFRLPGGLFGSDGSVGYVSYDSGDDLRAETKILISIAPLLSCLIGVGGGLVVAETVTGWFGIGGLWIAGSSMFHMAPSSTDVQNVYDYTQEVSPRYRRFFRGVALVVDFFALHPILSVSLIIGTGVWLYTNDRVVAVSILSGLAGVLVFKLLFLGYQLIFKKRPLRSILPVPLDPKAQPIYRLKQQALSESSSEAIAELVTRLDSEKPLQSARAIRTLEDITSEDPTRLDSHVDQLASASPSKESDHIRLLRIVDRILEESPASISQQLIDDLIENIAADSMGIQTNSVEILVDRVCTQDEWAETTVQQMAPAVLAAAISSSPLERLFFDIVCSDIASYCRPSLFQPHTDHFATYFEAEDPVLRSTALRITAVAEPEEYVDEITQLLDDPDEDVADEAHQIVERLSELGHDAFRERISERDIS
jgi:hypothetical protein